jgi:L-ascorbate metabolism protein UlaG (beta-lactamase superfamily)
MNVQLIRHATLLLHIGGLNLLVDPMLSVQGANPPIINTANDRRNPLVDLPFPLEDLLAQPIDAVLITHTHRDHFDEQAAEALP